MDQNENQNSNENQNLMPSADKSKWRKFLQKIKISKRSPNKKNMDDGNQGQARAKELFENTPIKKAIFIVAIPGLLTMIMMGLYAFINQVFILNFVPTTIPVFNGDTAPGAGHIYQFLSDNYKNLPDFNELQFTKKQFEQLTAVYRASGAPISDMTSDILASISVNATIPFGVFANAVVLLIPMGTSVFYTKCISKKVERTGKDLWATAFWMTLATSLLITLIIFITIWAGLVDKIASHSKFDTRGLAALENWAKVNPKNEIVQTLNKHGLNITQLFQDYYQAGHEMSVWWAVQYIYVYAAGSILQGLYLLFSYLIRAEGKNSYVMIWAIIANIVGLAFDAIFIIVCKIGVLGGGLATIIGWIVNVSAYFAYVWIGNVKKTTWIDLKHLFKFKFRYRLLIPITGLGMSAFMRTFGVAVITMVITVLLNYLPYSDGFLNVYCWSKSTPTITLFFLALFGISDGSSSLLSYNYTQRNVKRVREIYWWALLIAFIYVAVVYTLVSIFAEDFGIALHVPHKTEADMAQLARVATFIRINMARMVFYSFAIGGILLFRAINDIKMAIIVTAMETFMTFPFVISIFIGVGFALTENGVDKAIASLMVCVAFAVNAAVTAIIITILSVHWLYKTLPRIDKVKVTWSMKVENEFFERAVAYEKEWALLHNPSNEQKLV